MIRDLILKNRSYRRFNEDVAVERETLRELVDLARCSASGSNRQPLKYYLACTPDVNAGIYTWVDENGVRHYSDSPPEEAEDAKVVFPEYQYDESADKNRTLKDQQQMNALIEEIERENAREQAEAKKRAQ